MKGTKLPNFVVVGAPKCGTTSLYHYMAEHPDVFVPERKELHYFSHPDMARNATGPEDAHVLRSLCSTPEEYATYYDGAEGHAAVVDVSPSYLYYHDAAERMRTELGEPGIVVILRNPVEKAFSHYMHLVRDNREPLSFREGVAAEAERTQAGWAALWRYVGNSIYAPGVARYREVFGDERVLVLFYEDLRADAESFVARVFEFLGVDAGVRPDVERVYHRSGRPRSKLLANVLSKAGPVSSLARALLPEGVRNSVRAALQNMNTGAKDELDAETRAWLAPRFREDAENLAALLGRDVPWKEELS